jgi:spore germination protein YaaH
LPSRSRRLRIAIVSLLAATLLTSGPQTPAPVFADGGLVPLAPGQTQQGLSREVFGYLPYWELDSGMADYLRYDLLTTIAFFGVSYKADGTLDTTLPGYKAYLNSFATDIITRAHAAGVRTVITFQGLSLSRNAAFLSNPAARATFVQQAVALMTARGADGANLDIEGLDNQYFDAFGQLGAELKAAALAVNPNAQISVATNANVSGARMAAAALAAGVDRAFLMGYNYRVAASSPVGSIDPIVRADGGLSLSASLDLYAQYGVPLDRVILGIGYYGRTWPTAGPELHAARQTDTATYGGPKIFYPRTLPGSAVGTTIDYDQVEQAARLVSWDAVRSTWVQTYYNDSVTVAARMAFANQRGLAGLGIWALGYDRGQTGNWDAVAAAFAAVSITSVQVLSATPAPDAPIQPPGFTNTIDVVVTPVWRADTAQVSEISLSNDGQSWSDWQPIAPTVPWQLLQGPDGARTVWLRVRASNGAQSPVFPTVVVLDTTPPSVGPPSIAPVRGSTAGKTDIPVRISWPATDLNPIAAADLELSAGGSPFVTRLLPEPASRSVVLPLKTGVGYAFRVGATDAAGNAALPVDSAATTFSKTENSASAIRYSAGWRRVASTSASGGSLTSATAKGATTTYRFTGSGIAILGPVGPTRGVARVYIDDVLGGSLNAYSSVSGSRRILYSMLLESGAHTVRIVLAGPTTHPRVDLDAVVVTR